MRSSRFVPFPIASATFFAISEASLDIFPGPMCSNAEDVRRPLSRFFFEISDVTLSAIAVRLGALRLGSLKLKCPTVLVFNFLLFIEVSRDSGSKSPLLLRIMIMMIMMHWQLVRHCLNFYF